MHPAFRSRTHAYLVIGLLAFLFVLPLAVGRLGRPTREEIARSVGENMGPSGNFVRATYDALGDPDVLFVGSSPMYRAIERDEVARSLQGALGRPARVEWAVMWWFGVDLEYVLMRDYLARHTPKMVVLELPSRNLLAATPHRALFRWLRHGEFSDATAGLPARSRAAIYAEQVFGAPRHLLSLLRPNLVSKDEKTPARFEESAVKNRCLGFEGAPFKPARVTPQTNGGGTWLLTLDSPQVRLVPPSEVPLGRSPYVLRFLAAMGDLLRAKKIPVVLLHVPEYDEAVAQRETVEEAAPFGEAFGPRAKIVALPAAALFPGLTPQEIKAFYADTRHLNQNGSTAFTQAVAPAITQAYEELFARTSR